MRTGNNVTANQFSDFFRSGGTGINSGFYAAYVPFGEDRDVSTTDLHGADDFNISGFHHGIGSFYATDISTGFYHS